MSQHDPRYRVPPAPRARFRLSRTRWAHLGLVSLSLLPQIAIFADAPRSDLLVDASYVLTRHQMTLAMTGLYLAMVLVIVTRISLYVPILVMGAFSIYHFFTSFTLLFESFQGQGRIMAITFLSSLGYLGLFFHRYITQPEET